MSPASLRVQKSESFSEEEILSMEKVVVSEEVSEDSEQNEIDLTDEEDLQLFLESSRDLFEQIDQYKEFFLTNDIVIGGVPSAEVFVESKAVLKEIEQQIDESSFDLESISDEQIDKVQELYDILIGLRNAVESSYDELVEAREVELSVETDVNLVGEKLDVSAEPEPEPEPELPIHSRPSPPVENIVDQDSEERSQIVTNKRLDVAGSSQEKRVPITLSAEILQSREKKVAEIKSASFKEKAKSILETKKPKSESMFTPRSVIVGSDIGRTEQGVVSHTERMDPINTSVRKKLPEIVAPDPALNKFSLTESYLNEPKYISYIESRYSSVQGYERELDSLATQIESEKLDKLESFFGESYTNTLAYLQEMPVSKVLNLSKESDIRVRMKGLNIKYEIFLHWIDQIPAMQEYVGGGDMDFGELFALWAIESEMEMKENLSN